MDFDIPQKTAIEGLTWTPKKIIADERGAVMHMLKEGQFDFPVGEIYFSIVKPGVIKGWKLHTEMWQRFAVPAGLVEFVFVDEREQSRSKNEIAVFKIGPDNHGVLTVPPQIWYSFKNISDQPAHNAVVVNAASVSFRSGESKTQTPQEFTSFPRKLIP